MEVSTTDIIIAYVAQQWFPGALREYVAKKPHRLIDDDLCVDTEDSIYEKFMADVFWPEDARGIFNAEALENALWEAIDHSVLTDARNELLDTARDWRDQKRGLMAYNGLRQSDFLRG